MNLKNFIAPLFILSLLILVSCDNDVITDELEQTELLGKWKREFRSINNISSAAVDCCNYIEFKPDSQSEDWIGDFVSTGDGSETTGTFEVNLTEETIVFDFNNKQLTYHFSVNGDVLSFEYTEDGNEIDENWRKE